MLSHYIFLGLFYAVLLVVSGTVALSLWRVRRDLRTRRAEAISWQSCFHDLPARDRVCRHVFTGEFKQRTCELGFDCRECPTHAALIAKHPPEAGPLPDGDGMPGLEFTLDRFYHRGHAWAHPEPDATMTIGLDALGARLVSAPDAVELPAVGDHIAANGTAWQMRKREATVRILSPADGEVVAVGGPQEGWYLKVKPDGGTFDARHLLRGAEVRPWLMREMERLQGVLTPAHQAPSLADGGVPVEDIAAAYPRADWDAVCREMFLEP